MKKPEKHSAPQGAASAAAAIAAAHDASAAEAGAQAPANNMSAGEVADAGAAGHAAAPKAPALPETIDLAFATPLPPEVKAAASLVVTTKAKAGRRRAGYAFGREETVIPLAELSDDQIAALDADPLLTVMVRAPTRPPA